jgi:DNA-binding winged helix-turn-helix (wHTH) protein/TolB-like protein/Tfp pilus assembly protein PilF
MFEGKTVAYEFGPFRLSPSRWVLERGGETVPLTPRAYDTLLALVESRGRVLTKEELFQIVWKGAVVDENNLSQAISAVRKALGEGANGDRYVSTTPRRGYSFVAPVEEIRDDRRPMPQAAAVPLPPAVAAPARAPFRWRVPWIALVLLAAALGALWMVRGRADRQAEAPVRSLAVLPFRLLGAAGGNEHLGLALADAVITRLGYVRSLSVRPISAVLPFAEKDPVSAGRALSVDAVLEGRIQESEGRLRVTVQLIAVRQGTPFWSGKFDVPRADLFSLEDSVSGDVAYALAPRLSTHEELRLARHHSARPEAYEAYLRGRYFWSRRSPKDLEAAVREFEAAIAADERFAPAWSGLADARVLRGTDFPAEFALARAAAEKALSLDPDLAEAHASLAMARFFGEWDFAGAEREFQRALSLAPGYATAHDWYAYWLVSAGRFDEAVAEIRSAREIDPTSLNMNRDVGHILLYARRFDEAAAQLKSVVRMDPSYPHVRLYLAAALLYASHLEEASTEARALSAAGGDVEELQALIEARAGRLEALRRYIPKLLHAADSGTAKPDTVASAYGWLGDKDQAFRWLERDFEAHDFYLVFLKVDPVFDPLRNDPRFGDLLRKIGLSAL